MLSINVCDVVLWIVLPLHKAIWVFVYSQLYCLCISRATDGEWWTDIKKLKHTLAFFLTASYSLEKIFSSLRSDVCYFKHFGLHLLSLLPIWCLVQAVYFQDLGLCTQSLFTASLLTMDPTQSSDLLRMFCRVAAATAANSSATKIDRSLVMCLLPSKHMHAFTSSSQSLKEEYVGCIFFSSGCRACMCPLT